MEYACICFRGDLKFSFEQRSRVCNSGDWTRAHQEACRIGESSCICIYSKLYSRRSCRTSSRSRLRLRISSRLLALSLPPSNSLHSNKAQLVLETLVIRTSLVAAIQSGALATSPPYFLSLVTCWIHGVWTTSASSS